MVYFLISSKCLHNAQSLSIQLCNDFLPSNQITPIEHLFYANNSLDPVGLKRHQKALHIPKYQYQLLKYSGWVLSQLSLFLLRHQNNHQQYKPVSFVIFETGFNMVFLSQEISPGEILLHWKGNQVWPHPEQFYGQSPRSIYLPPYVPLTFGNTLFSLSGGQKNVL